MNHNPRFKNQTCKFPFTMKRFPSLSSQCGIKELFLEKKIIKYTKNELTEQN